MAMFANSTPQSIAEPMTDTELVAALPYLVISAQGPAAPCLAQMGKKPIAIQPALQIEQISPGVSHDLHT
jgi:hypothetical protein